MKVVSKLSYYGLLRDSLKAIVNMTQKFPINNCLKGIY